MKELSSIIERITLYDIMGYFLPGAVLGCLSILMNGQCSKAFCEMKKSFGGNWVFVAAILCYVMGIVLSEVSKLQIFLAESFLGICGCRKTEENMVRKNINHTEMGKCLKEMGLVDSSSVVMQHNITDYLPLVHASVQTDEKYHRVHNYESMKMMSKNLSTAFLAIAISMCILGETFNAFFRNVVCTGVAFLLWFIFLKRYLELKTKISVYECVWFIDKVHGKKNTV